MQLGSKQLSLANFSRDRYTTGKPATKTELVLLTLQPIQKIDYF